MNKFFLLLLAGLLITSPVWSQQRVVSGTVTDESGSLPGATIILKGSTVGTVSALDGTFSLDIPNDEAVLVVSFVGYTTQEERVGSRSVIDFNLLEDAKKLYEVVVTALGFTEKRDMIASTYSKIEADKLVQPVENKVIDGMAGKAAGLNISATSGDPGAGSNIQIRGVSSLGGSSQPLIVVDGVPLNNDNFSGQGDGNPAAGVSQQSRLNDLNPSDIESFQVFKGASAGALYGSRALNGVIVITTKQGKPGKFTATISTGIAIDEISYKHPLQKAFGQGAEGKYSPTGANSWGDRIAERSGGVDEVNKSGRFFLSSVTGDSIFPITKKNSRAIYPDRNFDQVFGAGVTSDTKFTISSGNEKGSYYLSGGYLTQSGIIKGSNYRKINFTASLSQNLSKKLSARFKANYINTNSNRTQQGSNTAGLYLGLLRTPPDFDITDYIGDYYSSATNPSVVPFRHRSYRKYLGNSDNPTYNNPLWTVKEQVNTSRVNRMVGTGQLTYRWNDHITSILRGGIDFYVDSRVYFFPWYTAGSTHRLGRLDDETINNQEINADFITSFRYPIVDKLDADITVGVGLNDRLRKVNFVEADNFVANFRKPLDPFELSKKQNISSQTTRTQQRNIRIYGTATLSYADQLILTAGGAFEKHSVLPLSKNGFFYPSVELGWQFSKLFNNLGAFSFGKVRLAYGQVANVPIAHRNRTTFTIGNFNTFSNRINMDDFGTGYKLSEALGNANLRPEIKTEYEAGLDFRFFENRLSLSTTYYQNETKDVLLNVPISPSLGFNSMYANGATIENRGFEVELRFDLSQEADRDWGAFVSLNFSTNRNRVSRIEGGGVIDFTPGSLIKSVAIEGQPLGVLYSQGALRDGDGRLVLDDNAFPQVDTRGSLVVGDSNPDWRGGIQFGVSYKKLSLSALFDTSQGNDMALRTQFILYNFGTHADVGNTVTLTKDLKNYKGETILAGTTVRGNIRDFGGGEVLLDENYYIKTHGFGDGVLHEFAVQDASWTRLREISLRYLMDFPGLRKAVGFRSIEFTASGRNLVIFTDVVGIDPDISLFGVGRGRGVEYFSNPGSRTYAFSIKFTY